LAPPFDFLARSFMPLIHRMGPGVELELRRPGFYPAGGGRFHARIEPSKRLSPLTLNERGTIQSRRAKIWLSKLSPEIADRELAVVREELRWVAAECSEHVTAIFTGFGERGRPAEEVAREAIDAAKAWLQAGVPVDEYLADQLLLPMALEGSGSFRTTKPSLHTITNAAIIRRFLPVSLLLEPESEAVCKITVGKDKRAQ